MARMAEKPSLIEALTPVRHSGVVPGVFRIRPVVVDTSFLLPDLLWCCERRRESTFLDCLRFGLLRPFAAHHVWAEVPRKIPDKATEAGVDRSLAEAVWWNEYVPRIRFVDVAGLPVPLDAEIRPRDASDAPTFALAGLLDPVVVLAPDRDLRDPGLAAPNWVAVVRAGDQMTFVAAGAWGGMVGARLGGYSIAAVGHGVARVVQQPLGQVALIAAVLLGLATFPRWWPRVRDRLPETGRTAQRFVFEAIMPLVVDFVEQYQAASTVWNDAAFSVGGGSLVQRAARALGASPVPLSRTQISRALLPDASEGSRRAMVRELEGVLQAHTAFVPVNQRRWQLGIAGPDLGADSAEVELLARRTRMLSPRYGRRTGHGA